MTSREWTRDNIGLGTLSTNQRHFPWKHATFGHTLHDGHHRLVAVAEGEITNIMKDSFA